MLDRSLIVHVMELVFAVTLTWVPASTVRRADRRRLRLRRANNEERRSEVVKNFQELCGDRCPQRSRRRYAPLAPPSAAL